MRRPWLITALLAATLLAMLAGCGQKSPPITTPPVTLDLKVGQQLYVRASALNLRQCPSTDCRILAVLGGGQAVRLQALKGGWGQVTTSDGRRRGWVAASYLDKNPPASVQPAKASEPPPLPKEQWAPAGQGGQQPPPVKEEFSK
jgi:uncharacterized protein YgiM (DUF1202 family)